MSVDTWSQRLHAEAFADDPPCADCGHSAEDHDEDGTCSRCPERFISDAACEGYRPIDPRDLERDEPMEDD